MPRFRDTHILPPGRARTFAVAHAVVETIIKYKLGDTDPVKILDIGCNVGDMQVDIQRIYPREIQFTGVDYGDFDTQLVSPMKFVLSDVKDFMAISEGGFGLTLCAWILVHLAAPPDDPFWMRLITQSEYLVTFENEGQLGFSLEDHFRRLGSIQIRHDAIELGGFLYDLRVFKNLKGIECR